MVRLDDFSTHLADALRQASEEQQRSACLAACEFAVRESGIESPLVDEALQALRTGKPLGPGQKSELDALASKIDDEYFEMQVAAEDGKVAIDDVLCRFGQARAAAALCFAADGDAFEAIYEAASASADPDRLIAHLMRSWDRVIPHNTHKSR